jgi:hypothetical protein
LLDELHILLTSTMNLAQAHGVLPSNSSLPSLYDDYDEHDDDSQSTEHAFGRADLAIPRFLGDSWNWVLDVYRTNFPGNAMVSENEIDREALDIWMKFFTCEAYQKYRKGPPETARRRKSQVWPDNLEGAFMKGTLPLTCLTC